MSSFPFSHCLQTGVLAKRTLPSSPSISKHFLSLPPSPLPPSFISRFREGSNPLHPEYALGGPQGPGSGWVLQLSPPGIGRGSLQCAVPSGSSGLGIWSMKGLNLRFSAFLAGWSGWRKYWKLPLLPAPLHGALAERGQVQCHHSGHDQVRWH